MNKGPELPQARLIGFCGQPDLRLSGVVAGALRDQLRLLQSRAARLLAMATLVCASDYLFAREALGLGIPLMVVLPTPGQEWKKNLTEAERTDFDQILSKAAKVEVLSASQQSQAAISIGEKLVNEADVLLTIWDGTKNGPAGETAAMVAHATSRACPVISIRIAGDQIEIREIKPGNDGMQARAGITHLQEMLGETPPEAVIPEELVRFFHECDTQASRTAPRVRRYVLNIVLANAIAAMAGTVQTSLPQTFQTGMVLTSIKFGCVLLGLGIFAVLRYRQSQDRWLDLRLKAEVCRSAMATWRSPRAVEPLSPEEIPELRGLIQTIRYLRATHHPAAEVPLKEFKADYGLRRLIDQHRYFQGQADNAVHLSSKLTPLYWIFSGLALLTSGGAMIYQSIFGHHLAPGTWMNFIFAFVPAIAPAMASWILAFQAIQSVDRRRSRFREMQRLMHQALADLIHSKSWETAHRVVEKAEKLLLYELLEWYSFVKYGR